MVKLEKLFLCHLLPYESLSGKSECICRKVSGSTDFYFMILIVLVNDGVSERPARTE